MADHDRSDGPENQRRRLLQAGLGRRGARRDARRGPARGARARRVRLEEVQGREDRGLPGQEPARRSPDQVPQGIRGHDGHHRRLRDDSRAAAAAEGGHRVQLGQAELRRDRDLVSRAEAPVRQEQVDGWTSVRWSPTSRSPIPTSTSPTSRRAGLTWATQPDGRVDSLPLNIDPWMLYYNKELFDAKGIAYPEELRRDDRRGGDGSTIPPRAFPASSRAGSKNANVPVWSSFLLGYGGGFVDDKGKLLTETQAAIDCREDVPDAAREVGAARGCRLQLERVAEPVRARQGRDVARRHRLRGSRSRTRPSRGSSARWATA